MLTFKDPYDELYHAIGMVVYEWAWLESEVAALVFDLCAIHSSAFYDDQGADAAFFAFHANIDLRSNISVAKTLAFQSDFEAGLFEKTENILNRIGNDLRNERNRYVHDIWYVVEGSATRMQAGTRITRIKGSGAPSLATVKTQRYDKVEDVRAFANKIIEIREELRDLSSSAQEFYRKKYPAKGSL